MARAFIRDGVEPVKTRKTTTETGVEIEIPYCNICGCEMAAIRLMRLSFWQPGYKYLRMFPCRLGTYLCEDCKPEEGFAAHGYHCVPVAEGQDLVSALKDYLNLLEEQTKR